MRAKAAVQVAAFEKALEHIGGTAVNAIGGANVEARFGIEADRISRRSGAQDEFLLAATAQNLRRMAKWLIPRAPKVSLAPG